MKYNRESEFFKTTTDDTFKNAKKYKSYIFILVKRQRERKKLFEIKKKILLILILFL